MHAGGRYQEMRTKVVNSWANVGLGYVHTAEKRWEKAAREGTYQDMHASPRNRSFNKINIDEPKELSKVIEGPPEELPGTETQHPV